MHATLLSEILYHSFESRKFYSTTIHCMLYMSASYSASHMHALSSCVTPNLS